MGLLVWPGAATMLPKSATCHIFQADVRRFIDASLDVPGQKPTAKESAAADVADLLRPYSLSTIF